MRIGTVGTVVGVLVLLGISGMGLGTPATTPAALSKIQLFDRHISHIVFLMQENHPYDSLYGTYCTTSGPYCPSTGAGVPAGTCVPKNVSAPTRGCFVPYNFTAPYLSPPYDLPHNWNSTHQAWNNGAMNGFYRAEWSNTETFGHYNGTTAPVYWNLAEEYGLADAFYSPVQSYSLPNHWMMLSSRAPAVSYHTLLQTNRTPWGAQSTYLNQSNVTPTIQDQLVNSSVSWAYYDSALVPYAQAIAHKPMAPAYDYWNPLEGRAQSYTAAMSSHIEDRSAFFSDAANGTLPNLSWIIPAAVNSDHPPYNLTSGQDWVASIVDALELSPEWNSTVLFVSWDEYGGFYDHVAPPTLDANGDGFRVPLLAVGPWVRQGFIDHTSLDFDSILHLMEERYGLKCLGPRDCKAKLPLAMFNFQRGPRAPIQIFPYAQASYPMPLQSSGQLPYYGTRMGAAPVAYVDPAATPLDPGIDWS